MANPERKGFIREVFNFMYNLFSTDVKRVYFKKGPTDKEIRMEARYWPEVQEFMNTLNALVKSHTIDDSNVEHINGRIMEYILHQINAKGAIENVNERYEALDTLADRILSNSLSKIVGLKHNESNYAEFTEVVEHFKERLHQRHNQEIHDITQH